MRISAVILSLLVSISASGEPYSPPDKADLDFLNTSFVINERMNRAIGENAVTGAVLLIGHDENVIFKKAYGTKTPRAGSEPMTIDTIFDTASLTKILVTAPAVMMLAEQRKLDIDAPLAKIFPAAGKGGHKNITIRQLMTHYSGLTGTVGTYRKKGRKYIIFTAKEIMSRIYSAPLEASPGKSFVYSDIGFIILGKIIEKVSGEDLSRFAAARIFAPLGMKDTLYNPGNNLVGRIAASEEQRKGSYQRGHVQDPLAGKLSGVTGHAGVFSTAEDLGRFARAMLDGGILDGKRILKPETVAAMVSPQTPPGKEDIRGLGWDIESRYSVFKGEYMPLESFGHTGYTGTSMWIDPSTRTYIILLTSRPNLADNTAIRDLRTDISNITGAFFHPALMKMKGN
jgi:CubicO group peptidase (beta-lactamase class C family)